MRWSTILALLLVGSGCRRAAEPVPATEAGVSPVDGSTTMDTLQLYFPSGDGKLHSEPHQVARLDQLEQRVARLVEELAAGPVEKGLWSPLPDLIPPAVEESENANTNPPPTVRAYLVEATIYVDLTAPGGSPSVGARQELLMLYSLVNSVLLNTPEANQLVVLWNGKQTETFAGHIDTGRPLALRPGLIAQPAS